VPPACCCTSRRCPRRTVSRCGTGAFILDRSSCPGRSKFVQMLPLGPTGYGNSPYQPVSFSPETNYSSALTGSLRMNCCGRATLRDARSRKTSRLQPWFLSNKDCVRESLEQLQRRRSVRLRPAYELFEMSRRTGWRTTVVPGSQLKFGGAQYLEWPAELFQRQAAALD